MIFSAKSASKKQVIRQYYLFFVLSFNEKSLSQDCYALEGVHFSFRTNNKIADNPGGYQDFLCSYG